MKKDWKTLYQNLPEEELDKIVLSSKNAQDFIKKTRAAH